MERWNEGGQSASIRKHRATSTQQLANPRASHGPALVTGALASVATTAVLAALARAEGKGALQPTNSTSHWLHGDSAGRVREADIEHTLLGYATHHASAVFWAVPFHWWLSRRAPGSRSELLRDSAIMAAIAAAVDYGLVPRRLTPGWETVLSKRSIAATYAALACGLAGGAMLSQIRHHTR